MYLQAVYYDPKSTQQPAAVQASSRICIKDLDTGEVFTFCVVLPEEHDTKAGKISLSTSLGAALIGKGVGNVVIWQAPSRLRRFEVQFVV